MKKYLLIIIILLLLTSCKTVAIDYTLEEVKRGEFVVHEDGSITSGQAVWDSFVEQTEQKKRCSVRLAFYYTLGDPERYDPDYYEEIKNDYPVLYVQDLKFDGKEYKLTWTEEDKDYSFKYKYMVKYTGEPSSTSAIFSSYTYYVLVNDDTVTWEQIEHGMFSSRFGDWIDHYKVYSNLKYK
ncbi:MAG: hypothetical protein FWF15_04500 [Oscillospiraceae bacterium]|nr:hypothetical protein [Oscillospiraceae bacterium]